MPTISQGDKVQGSVELGPRSLALLRRICAALEALADMDGEDPGRAFETIETEDGTVAYIGTVEQS